MALESGNKSKKVSKANAPGAAGVEGVRAEVPAAPNEQPKPRPVRSRRAGQAAGAKGAAAADVSKDPGLVGIGGGGTGSDIPVQAEACATPEGLDAEAGGKIGSAEEVLGLVTTMRKRLFEKEEVKPSVADFIRLLQLYREMAGEGPKEITIRWIDKESPGR
jgi:hypothetical protein